MRSGRAVYELAADAHTAACLAHAAFEDVTNPQFAPDLLNVYGSPLVGKAGVPCDDKKTAKARQCSNDLLDHTISEILLLAVAAQVVKGQNGYGGFVGKWGVFCSRPNRSGACN